MWTMCECGWRDTLVHFFALVNVSSMTHDLIGTVCVSGVCGTGTDLVRRFRLKRWV